MVVSTGKGKSAGGYLALNVVVFKEQGGGVSSVHLLLGPLPVVCSSSAGELSAGAVTISRHSNAARWKTDGPQTSLLSASSQWRATGDLESHWFAERLAFQSGSLTEKTLWKRKVEVAFPDLALNSVAESR